MLTGYAIVSTRRHHRNGHLFQNRYKSILCEEDIYLKELVRYIRLNPIRAKVVNEAMALDRYRYSGHSYLMGQRKTEWQTLAQGLAHFGDRLSPARRRYHAYLKKGLDQG